MSTLAANQIKTSSINKIEAYMKRVRITSIIIAALLAVSAGIVCALELTNTTHLFHKSSSTNNTGVPGPINYGPPTKTDKIDSESHKSTPPTKNTTGGTSEKREVTVTISTWAQKDGAITVNGFVGGVVEDGGTCTLTMTFAATGKQVTTSRTAIANVTNTSCGESTVPVSKLSSGSWHAVLAYSSSASSGQSSPVTIDVE
jgi:hypothetical protein